MELELSVIDADYTAEDEVTVRAFGKTLNGENVLIKDPDFLPYFYAIPEDLKDAEKQIKEKDFTDDKDRPLKVEKVEKVERLDGLDERKVLKIYTDIPAKVPKLKYSVEKLNEVKEAREFDIPFYKRFLIDKEIRPGETVKIKCEELEEEGKNNIDYEVKLNTIEASREELPDFDMLAFDLEVIDDQIIMASFQGPDFSKVLSLRETDKEFVEAFESEKKLLERFQEIIEERDTDIITGYNTDEFDFKKLRERFQDHGLELSLGRDGERVKFDRRGRFSSARLKGRMHLDLFPFISHVVAPGLDSETLDLDSVAKEILGKEKDDVSFEQMQEWWKEEKNTGELAEYNLKDSELAFELAQELIPQVMELSRITGLIPFDACRLTYGQLTENFLLREAFNRNMLSRNRPTRNERRRRSNQGAYEGGFVYTPDSGLYENISVFDFRSLYPTVMVAHNISPEMLDLEDCEEEFSPEEFNFSFCQDEQGFFPELIEELVKSRYELKDSLEDLEEGTKEYEQVYSRQQAQKILANSFYGYLGYDGARWYSKESAQATTYMGRMYIEDTIELARDMGFEIVYGDTDSVFIRGEDVEERREEFLEQVNDELPEFMELEFEGHFTRGLFTSKASGEGAKKKYALMDEDENLKITGFEQVRRDWSPVAKDTQKKVLSLVLKEEISEAAEEVKNTIEQLKDQEIPVEGLTIHTTLTKPPEEYGSKAPHVEAVKKAKERGLTIEPEATVKYVITRGGGSISDRAELSKFAENYDPDYYIDNQVVPAATRVLKVFGYTEDQLKGKGKQSGLGRFQ